MKYQAPCPQRAEFEEPPIFCQAHIQPIAILFEPSILSHATFPIARLLLAPGMEAPRPIIFPLLVSLNPSTLLALNTISAQFVLPIKSFAPIELPESDQSRFGAMSELVEVQVARPLASLVRILFSHGDPPPIVICPER